LTKSFRVIARIDLKSSFLIKGINFEGMRKLGNANQFSKKYFQQGADEILINDVNASLFGRSTAINFLRKCCKEIFIPVILAGGLNNIESVYQALRNGADKVAINTAAVKNKKLIKSIVEKFGSQALIISINAKKITKNKWEVFIDKGRERTNINVFDWAKYVEKSGAGEILINSIDKDGTLNGFDYDLIDKLSKFIKLPLICGGGLGHLDHLKKLLKIKNIGGLVSASALHYEKLDIKKIKKFIKNHKVEIRI
jgi:cyclase